MLIDTHCHLTDKRLYRNIEEVIGRAKEAGVKKMIVPGLSLKDSRAAVEIANRYDNVYCLVGIHPESVGEIVNFEELKRLIESSSWVVGIGEIGLDFYHDKEKKTKVKQIELFRFQLELAVKFGLPVAIHAREAEKEIREVLESVDKLPKGQFHCWSGNKDFLEYVLGKGFYVSFCGNITYKNRRSLQTAEGYRTTVKNITGSEPSCARPILPRRLPLRDLLKRAPIDRLLLETDSPYLPPEPMRGKLNEPANVKITAKFMADVLNVSINNLINKTTVNSLCLFRLGN